MIHYFVVTAINAAGESSVSNEISATPKKQTWTIMVYGHGDHNLTLSLYNDMIEMEAVGSNADFSIVVGADYNATEAQAYQLPTTYRTPGFFEFLLQTNSNLNALVSQPVTTTEKNLDDPNVLSTFILNSITQYPADRYGLVLWNHGGQWSAAFGGDQQDGGGSPPLGNLSLSSLKQAISSSIAQSGISKLDFIGMDTCLNGAVEFISAFATLADVYIACPEVDFGAGWDYTATLGYLKSNPGASITQFATQEVAHWRAHHFTANSPDDMTLGAHAAYDLTRVNSFQVALDAFSDALTPAMVLESEQIARIRRSSNMYSMNVAELDSPTPYVDLGDFVSKIAAQSSDSSLVSAAQSLSTEINSLVISAAKGSARNDASGLSIYFPANWWTDSTESAYITQDFNNYKLTNIATSSRWDEFLNDYFVNYWQADGQAPTVVVTPGNSFGVTVSNPATGTIAVSGSDANSLSLSAWQETSPGSKIYLDFGEFDNIEVSGSAYSYTWDGQGLIVSDGTNASYMSGRFAYPGASIYYCEAVLTTVSGSQDVLLVLDTNSGLLVNALDATNASLTGLDVSPGNTILPYFYQYDLNGSSGMSVSVIPGTTNPIVVPSTGISGLQVYQAPLPTGNYLISLWTDDVWDNTDVQMAAVGLP
ncbi:MAG: clostripain-related cysteine peptidase [Planctomycetes bacterium]|nr:clostripain-related cysteine peptidase [Planctomycetota bacterium]